MAIGKTAIKRQIRALRFEKEIIFRNTVDNGKPTITAIFASNKDFHCGLSGGIHHTPEPLLGESPRRIGPWLPVICKNEVAVSVG